MIERSVPQPKRIQIARANALKEAIERYNNELMDDEERLEVLARMRRLKKSLRASRVGRALESRPLS